MLTRETSIIDAHKCTSIQFKIHCEHLSYLLFADSYFPYLYLLPIIQLLQGIHIQMQQIKENCNNDSRIENYITDEISVFWYRGIETISTALQICTCNLEIKENA